MTGRTVRAPRSLRRDEAPPPPDWYRWIGPFVHFEVDGIPAPQGAVRHLGKGRPSIHANQDSLLPWRQKVAAAAHNAMVAARRIQPDLVFPIAGPVALACHFTVPKPKVAPKTRVTYPTKRPDLSHLVRAIEDSISSGRPDRAMGRVLVDDSQIVDIATSKAYPGEHIQALNQPGVIVRIYRIGESQ